MPDFLYSEQEGILIFSQNGMLRRNPKTGNWEFQKLKASMEEMAKMNFKKVGESEAGFLITSSLNKEEAKYETKKDGGNGNHK